MFQFLFYLLYGIVVIAIGIRLLLSGTQPTKTLAWLVVVFLIPVAGIVLYLMLGQNRRKNKFYRLKRTKDFDQYLKKINQFYNSIEQNKELAETEVAANYKLAKLIIKNSNFLPTLGNQVTLLKNGQATYDALFSALEKAKHFIHFQYYIFDEGDLAARLVTLFEKKRKEGVEIRIIYDGVGSRKLSNNFIKYLEKIGVQIFGFLPLRFGSIVTTFNYRNHRKNVIVDGKVGFTGGINFSDKYLKVDPYLGPWHDLHLQIEGPAVNSLQAVFAADWRFVSDQHKLLTRKYFPPQADHGESGVQIVWSGPDSDFASVRQQYFTIISQAKKYVFIANSYVIPGEAILEALQTAALSGVDVRIMMPTKSDCGLVKWSMQSYFEALLEAGVKIYLYPKGFLHSKMIVADDSVASIGTANLDIRSFEQNFEINAVIYSAEFAADLKKYFLADGEKSSLINYPKFLKRSRTEKLKEGVGRVFSPIL